jgi:DNA-binding transcriptional LysR family regulator
MHWDNHVGRRLKLHDLRILLAVAEAGSMAKAAARLATSQPTISRAIADMEHTLGVPLLDRSTQGVEPTQYGRAILKRGVAVFDELKQGVQDIEFLSDPPQESCELGVPQVWQRASFSPSSIGCRGNIRVLSFTS